VIQNGVLEWVRGKGLGWGVISEDGPVEKGDGEKVLYIDPLDGSHNAKYHIPFYSTSLALFDVESGDLTHAMVIDIPSGRIYHSQRNGGSYCDGERLHVREHPLSSCAFSAYIGPESSDDDLNIIKMIKRTRYFGCDSLEMCLVARGSLDGALYFGRIPRKTDLAASLLIVREAGGEVFSIHKDGKAETLDMDSPWEDLKGIVSLGWPDNIQMLLARYNDGGK
jgi:fructose-1,6-bisphosphatase/inositol monophosphatase family enzyme